MFDAVMLGGYAIEHTSDTALLNYDYRNYTTLDNMSFWAEIQTNGTKFQFGLFGGYTKNLASMKNILNWKESSSYFGRGRNIDYVYRVSPRVIFNSGKVRLAGEIEYTVAAYAIPDENGITYNSLGEIQASEEVANIRLLLAAYYFF